MTNHEKCTYNRESLKKVCKKLKKYEKSVQKVEKV